MSRIEYETKPEAHEILDATDVEVFILAGGKGSRLRNSDRPELQNTPKVLVSINTPQGKVAMLDNAIIGLNDAGFYGITLLISDDPDSGGSLIETHALDTHSEIPIKFSRERTPLGTAGAVYRAFSSRTEQNTIVTPADTLFPFEVLQEAVREHRQRQAGLTWLVTTNPGTNAQNTGRILVDSENKAILYALENVEPNVYETVLSSNHLIPATSAGVIITNRNYYVSKYEEFIKQNDIDGVVDLYRTFIPWLISTGEIVYSHDIGQPAPDLGTPDRLEQFGWR